MYCDLCVTGDCYQVSNGFNLENDLVPNRWKYVPSIWITPDDKRPFHIEMISTNLYCNMNISNLIISNLIIFQQVLLELHRVFISVQKVSPISPYIAELPSKKSGMPFIYCIIWASTAATQLPIHLGELVEKLLIITDWVFHELA